MDGYDKDHLQQFRVNLIYLSNLSTIAESMTSIIVIRR